MVSIYLPNLAPFLANSKSNEIRVLDPPENSYSRRMENRRMLGKSPEYRRAAIASTHVAEFSTSHSMLPKTPIAKSDFVVFQSRGAPARTHVIRWTF